MPGSAFVISGWGVLDPLLRYHLAKQAGNAELVENHHAFWGDEATMSEGSPPAILDRGEKVDLPPALVFGGDADEWVPVETMRRLVDGWKKAGGEVELELYRGANHGFMTGKPDAPYAKPGDRAHEGVHPQAHGLDDLNSTSRRRPGSIDPLRRVDNGSRPAPG